MLYPSIHRSITSRCTAPTSSSDCQHMLNRSFSSSQRFNNQWYPNTHSTNLASGGHALVASQQGTGHGSQHHHPPQRCFSSQRMNGGPGLLGNGAAGPERGSANYNYHSPYCQSAGQSHHQHGRLHKSLSFAFQSPTVANEDREQQSCQQQPASQYAADYPPSRCYSRWASFLLSKCTPNGVCRQFGKGAIIISIRAGWYNNNKKTILIIMQIKH